MKGINKNIALLALATLPSLLCAQDISAMRPVTDERLRNPEPENWLMFRREYSGSGYSPLEQITPDNVGRLCDFIRRWRNR